MDFLYFLQKFKNLEDGVCLIEHTDHRKLGKIVQSNEFYRYESFKKMICELFYQAIQSVPSIITEYTISCKNDKRTTHLVLGVFDELDCDGEACVAKIITEESVLLMDKDSVHNMYIANRTKFYNAEEIDKIMGLFYDAGSEPKISISYIVAKRDTKM